jgi:hypothetical protein
MRNSRSNMDTVKSDAAPKAFTIAVGTWGHKKTKLKNRYIQLNDADLYFETGKERDLTGRLQAKLNKSEAEVQELIKAL